MKDQHITTANRPPEVSAWFKCGRVMSSIPSIDISTFPASFRKYWCSIQPPWRRVAHHEWPLDRMVPDDSEWTNIRRSGKTGFFVIVLMLIWWRSSVVGEHEKKEFVDCLKDVIFVLECILVQEEEEGPGFEALKRVCDTSHEKDKAGGSKLPSIECAPPLALDTTRKRKASEHVVFRATHRRKAF